MHNLRLLCRNIVFERLGLPDSSYVLGMGVDAQAIRNRVAKLRGKAKDLGVAPGEMSVPAKPGKKQAQVSDKTKAKGAKLGGKKLDSNPR